MYVPLRPRTRGRGRNFVKVGTAKVFWYRLRDGRTQIDARKYGRKLVTKADHEEALREARRIAIEVNSGGVEVLALSAHDRANFAQGSAIAARRGTDLPSALTEWDHARELLGDCGHALADVVRAGLAALARPIHLTVDVVGELLASKAIEDLDGRTRRDLRHQLRDFAKAHPGDIGAITSKQVQDWLDSLRRRDGGKLSAKRRNHHHGILIQLFRFARSREYLPDKLSAAQKIEKGKVRRGAITTFNVGELQSLLTHVEQRWLPYLAISALSGLRSEELWLSYHAADRKDALRWEDFDWHNREICVREEVAKTGVSRRCPISDNLFAWLSPWREAKERGRVATGSIAKWRARFRAKLADLAEKTDSVSDRLASPWPHNVLRHSYCSHEVGRAGNVQQVAYWMGDSPAMVKRHYNNPRPKADAAAWFAVFPTQADNVVQLTLPGVRSA